MVSLTSTITVRINRLALLFREKGIVLFIFLKSDVYKYLYELYAMHSQMLLIIRYLTITEILTFEKMDNSNYKAS